MFIHKHIISREFSVVNRKKRKKGYPNRTKNSHMSQKSQELFDGQKDLEPLHKKFSNFLAVCSAETMLPLSKTNRTALDRPVCFCDTATKYVRAVFHYKISPAFLCKDTLIPRC